ncbi:MAG: molybdenum ABC transporter ATP-binding protein [Pseudomonadota bacterium]
MSLYVDIKHSFPGFTLDAQFTAPSGVTALFGRSGSGKSTLVNAIAGLLRPDRGTIRIDDETLVDIGAGLFVPAHRRRLGYVFQDARLFPHVTVRQNLLYGARRLGIHTPENFDEIVGLLDLGALQDRYPLGLSGGETQRVAIGRALLSQPRMLLMDEPLASLDAARKAEILPYLDHLRSASRVPILYVSHSVAEVARLATSVALIETGQIAEFGPAQRILSDPQLVRQLGLREAGAFLQTHVVQHHADGLTELKTEAGRLLVPTMSARIGSCVRVRILAQDVILATSPPEHLSALNVLPATITGMRSGTGPGMTVQLACGSDLLLARITRRSAAALSLAEGQQVFAVIKAVSIDRAEIGIE